MTALPIGATTLVVLAIGWLGMRAYRRIQVWGRNMNECDRIFQEMATDDELREVRSGRELPHRGISLVSPLETPHRPV